jgi:peptidoglycan/LPS O-acetylase OafA/YrhL
MSTPPIVDRTDAAVAEPRETGLRSSAAATHTAEPRRDLKIRSLDGVRAVSILLVFSAHGMGLQIGSLGVTIFFFLSGYLITTLLRREYDVAHRINFTGFYLRRFFRIYPPMCGMLVMTFVLCRSGILDFDFTSRQAAVALLQLSNYVSLYWPSFRMPPGTGILWSLAVEEHFYFLFPIAYAVLRGRVRRPLHQAMILWAICALILLWRLTLVLRLHASVGHLAYATDTRLDSILFGCALGVYGNPALDAESRFSRRFWLYVLLPLALLLLGSPHLIHGNEWRESLKYSLQGIALVPIFCAVVRYPTAPVVSILNWRPIAFLGVLSYSFYLVHYVIVSALDRSLPPRSPTTISLAFGLSLLVSWAFHVAIERPSNRLRKHLPAARPAGA